MAQIRVRIIGECVIEIGDRQIGPEASHLFALLLYLAEEHGRSITRSELIEVLFEPNRTRQKASHSLRQLLYRAKRLGAQISLHQSHVRLLAQDVLPASSDISTSRFDERLSRLKATYTVLPHYEPHITRQFTRWTETLRERLNNELRIHFGKGIALARQYADWEHLEVLSRRALEIDPLNESAVLGLAEATARSGSKALALSMLDTYRRELGEERAGLALPAKLLGRRIDNYCSRPSAAKSFHVRMIGRTGELSRLLTEWQSAQGGRFRGVVLFGDKSIGKSRVAEELAATVSMNGIGRVLRADRAPSPRDRPLGLLADLASQLVVLPGAAGCDPLSLHLLARLSGTLATDISVPAEHGRHGYQTATVRNAFVELISSVTEEQPLLCIVDDADQLDAGSVALLPVLADRLRDRAIMLVLCTRRDPSQTPRLASPFICIRLKPLDPSASRDLFLALANTGSPQVPEALADWCLDIAAGNPGHLELLVRDVGRAPAQPSVPSDLIALMDRRIEGLPVHAQYMLQALSVITTGATPADLMRLTGLSTKETLTALHILEDASLITQSPDGLRCSSAFVGERTRQLASRVVLAMMEGRAAELLEEAIDTRRCTPSTAWRIASHWTNAHQAHRARVYLRACWRHSISIGQPISAASAIRATLESSQQPAQRAELLDDLIGALQAAGDMPAVIAAVKERRSLTVHIEESAGRLSALSFDEEEARVMSQSTPSLHVGALRSHVTSSHLDGRRKLRAARLLMMGADGALDGKLARDTLSRSEGIDTADSSSALLRLQISLIYNTVFGDPDEALRIADTIAHHIQGMERSWNTFVARRNCSLARQLVGVGNTDYAELDGSYAEALGASMTASALSTASHLTSVLVDDGNIDEARKWMSISESLASGCEMRGLPMDYLSAQVDLALLDGNIRRARHFVSQMRKNAPRYNSVRLKNDLLIYRLRLRQLSGAPPVSEDEIARLLAFHDVARSFGRHDDHMDVLWTALVSTGQQVLASELLLRYLRDYRRERRRCRYFLRLRTQSDPAWSSVMLQRGAAAQAEG